MLRLPLIWSLNWTRDLEHDKNYILEFIVQVRSNCTFLGSPFEVLTIFFCISVANLTTSPPSSSTPGDTAETTFISSSGGGGGPTSTGSNRGYMRLSSTVMAPPSQPPPGPPPPCRGRHPRWNNEMPSSVQVK